ncbi:hypothetical protein O181_046643 [Austropuccinia psidii MF-1]|uniref:Aminotransferase class I/classII large domain-containing protein n=1 Tax=Austropuccinia psidii MF-1 TaxID=1389203 RepID=A0A9Q3DSQ4_9BASI|nr:hypothetical protein [Austropuccinia psidii MF-1]
MFSIFHHQQQQHHHQESHQKNQKNQHHEEKQIHHESSQDSFNSSSIDQSLKSSASTPSTDSSSILTSQINKSFNHHQSCKDKNNLNHQLSHLPPTSNLLSKLKPIISFDDDLIQSNSNQKIVNPTRLNHSEFGFDQFNQAYRRISQLKKLPNQVQEPEEPEEPGYWVYLTTYLSYLILIIFGHLRDFFGKKFKSQSFSHLMPNNGYAALNSDFDSFYTRRLKARLDDCFARPVTGVAGRTISLINRVTHDHCRSFQYTGNITQALNISSYNYLGFAQSSGYVSDRVENLLNQTSVSIGSPREEVGSTDLHIRCEKLIAKFLGVEDAILISQGFATNSSTLPVIASKGTLIISDELNHSSIRFGSRLSGGMVRQYKHNDMNDLCKLLRESISQGQPRSHRPWKKIIVIVEGIYSMEGSIVNLPALYQLKAIYKFYLYVDEAHSIGALGPNGKGVTDYYGLDPNGIDILMGTLTKSFGANGGYIAGKASIIGSIRLKNHASIYGEPTSPPVIQQIISSLTLIAGMESPSDRIVLKDKQLVIAEGQERLKRLAFNARYLSSGLRKLGFIVYGDRDSPIIPLLIFHPGKMAPFSRMMLERYSIVVVVVAYPATPLVSSRVRFCVSASHTKEDIDKVLIATNEVGEILGLKMSKRNGFEGKCGRRWSIDEVLERSLELVED